MIGDLAPSLASLSSFFLDFVFLRVSLLVIGHFRCGSSMRSAWPILSGVFVANQMVSPAISDVGRQPKMATATLRLQQLPPII